MRMGMEKKLHSVSVITLSCVFGARERQRRRQKKTWLNRSFVRQIWTAIKALLVHCKHHNHLLAVECVWVRYVPLDLNSIEFDCGFSFVENLHSHCVEWNKRAAKQTNRLIIRLNALFSNKNKYISTWHNTVYSGKGKKARTCDRDEWEKN